MKHYKLNLFLVAMMMAAFFMSCTQQQPAPVQPKNVIVFVGDGMGFNYVDATSLYFYGKTGQLLFEGPDWVQVASATYPAIMKPGEEPVYAGGYNPRKAWEDPDYLHKDYTDSGASGTALSTGFSTYYGSIGIGVNGDTLQHISSFAKDIGKAAGVITSVQISHATPASFVAHNEHRNNYAEIGRQMILKSRMDVIMGAGHPLYDNDGMPAEGRFRFVGGEELWSQLTEGEGRTSFVIDDSEYVLADINGDGQPDAWTLITDSARISDVAAGSYLPARSLGIPQVHSTLQQSRSGEEEYLLPWEKARLAGMPTLEQMTRAAVNVLNQNQNGFFLMVEGGAIDWAGHDNHGGRMIEEMEDFIASVKSAVEWVETYSSWDETLIIVTSDHETGMLLGPNGENPAYGPETTNTIGSLPPMSWHSGSHTNSLVPFYAKGKGSELFVRLADNHDPVRGEFLRNTDVAKGLFLLWDKK